MLVIRWTSSFLMFQTSVVVVVIDFYSAAAADEELRSGVARGCQFPMNWWGSWYQSGLGMIDIRGNEMTKKGTCQENHRDFFLIENRRDGCHQCLLILSRHPNLVQYKESYCIGPESMHSLCGRIRIEAVLYTMIREVSQPVPCPFQNAFHLIYNNNSGGFCRNPDSYAHRCAMDSKFHFRFHRCGSAAYTFDKDMDLDCLAEWKDGSDTYFYGAFLSDNKFHSKEDKYRCFMYITLGSVVYLSMSADATCRGLRSPKDGPLVIELTEDSHGWPTSDCEFPSWIRDGRRWSDLSRRNHYSILRSGDDDDDDDDRLEEFSNRLTFYGRGTSGGEREEEEEEEKILMTFKCVKIHGFNGTTTNDNGPFFLSHVLDDNCQPRYQCLRFQRRHFYILLLEKGDYMPDMTSGHRCPQLLGVNENPNFSQQLLISDTLTSGACPFEGRYADDDDDNDTECRLEIIAGCQDKSKMDVTSSCHKRPILRLTCLLWWNEADTLFFLAKNSSKNGDDDNDDDDDDDDKEESEILCYFLRPVGTRMVMTEDRTSTCIISQSSSSSTADLNSQQRKTFAFNNYLDECPSEEENVISDQNDEFQPENSYRFVFSSHDDDVIANPDQVLFQTFLTPASASSSTCRTTIATGNRFLSIAIVVITTLTSYDIFRSAAR